MGGGIAMAYANAGIPVLLKEVDQAALDRGLATIRKNYESTVAKGKMTPEALGQDPGAHHADDDATTASTRSTSSSRPCSRTWI